MDRCIALRLAMIVTAIICAPAVNRLHAQKAPHSHYEIPIWKTITLGTYRDVNVLRDALNSGSCRIQQITTGGVGQAVSTIPIYNKRPAAPCRLEDLANEIIGRPEFTLSRTRTEVDLVVLSAFDLGFGSQEGGSGASIGDIYARAKLLGLALCPPEVGPQLRLQYLDQPPDEVLHIAMRPIARWHGEHVALSVANDDAGLVLFGYGVDKVTMSSRALFVFVKPRYGEGWNSGAY